MDSKRSLQDIGWSTLGRVAIFIDAANVIYSLRDLGWHIDYKRFQSFFDQETSLAGIYFYSAYFKNDWQLLPPSKNPAKRGSR